jgi:hypothetical protein
MAAHAGNRANDQGRWIVPLPATPLKTVRSVKGSLLYNSYRQIVESGHEAAYIHVAGEAFAAKLRTVPPTGWVPIDVAREHYANVDAMHLAPSQIRELAENAVKKLNGIFLQTIARASRVLGADAETAFRYATKVWPRLYEGGAVAVERVAHGLATIHVHGLSLMAIPYFRLANGIFFRAVLKLLSDDVRVREAPHDPARAGYQYIAQWRE